MVTQGHQGNIDSPANMLQQQHSYEVSERRMKKEKFYCFVLLSNARNELGVDGDE
jgi:hypothetical protein